MTVETEVDAAAGAMFAGDGRALQRWLLDALAGQDGGTAPLPAEALDGLAHLTDLLGDADAWTASGAASARALVPEVVRSAAARPAALTALLLHVRHACERAWELTWDHGTMADLMDVVDAAWQELPADRREGTEVCRDLLLFLRHEFAVESAMLTGCLPVAERVVGEALAEVRRIVASAEAAGADCLDQVRDEVRREVAYFEAVDTACRAAIGFLGDGEPSVAPAIEALRRDLAGPLLRGEDASEVRSQLAALEALDAARSSEWLRVDEGSIVVLYPFSLRSPASAINEQVVAAVRAHGRDWDLGGLVPTEPPSAALEISDAWQGDDALGRHFAGTELVLPDLELRRTPDVRHGACTRPIRVKVQFSELGNHCVRFELAVADADPSDLAEIVSTASPVYGDLDELGGLLALVRADDPAGTPTRWPRLAAVASTIIRRVADEVDRAVPHHVGVDGRPAGVSVGWRRGMYSVIGVIDRARICAGAQDTVGRVADDARVLPRLFGAQPLVHPMPGGATSIADWASYDVEDLREYPILTLHQEILVANANTTLLASFRSPAYSVGTVRGYVEFAHSLHGMYAGWNDEVAKHAQEIAAAVDVVDRLLAEAPEPAAPKRSRRAAARQRAAAAARDRVSIETLQRTIVAIERSELELQRFVQSNQATMLFIESPALVTSTSLRLDLDTVLESSGYPALRDGFVKAKEQVLGNRLQQLLEITSRRIADRLEERRNEQSARTRQLIEAVGIGIMIIGLSGLVSVLQAGYDLSGLPTLAAVLILVVLAGVFAFLNWRATRELRALRDQVEADRGSP
ncbi:hypothetical protein OEB99_19020 [Actinotalea sp. M2MS4P-6]|uniref:hypothetical protein n=1 Tax=Actinotalea sp. M2MS4P-6 TaxID=2983762 RepID=UPI0021E4B7AC|nr:hypothetical protein [Actinotalea sp. M2MS4P-6]MCV2396408.1 hypothetical protein [Actinotalea sp. M2MS4P-6]